MKTKTPPRAARPADPTLPPPLITAEGVAAYVRCRREWWLADVQDQATGLEARAARAILARRRALARSLTTIGAGLIAVAILLVAAGLLLG